jgi:ubiquinone/menaquinone biosynthesis C-methylase UbiE
MKIPDIKQPWFAVAMIAGLTVASSSAQEKSVRPGVNDNFKNPDAKKFVERFETESREVFSKRKEIADACPIRSGDTVADIGAGTGLFTRIFSEKVGPNGKVIAVDIADNFLDHIEKVSQDLGQKNVSTQLCTADSTKLAPSTIDVAYICDVYHHFEFPEKSMKSLFEAMKPGGKLVLVEFQRIEGVSSEFALKHVRAGQEVFESEITGTGFRKVKEVTGILKENYMVIFEKPKS